ncbi:MAG: winged helix-turn-helix transcriptional regulator [Spirochaetales bacterium]|nr:winged helix-turn-helix transcriptional regulator [Spirochaetales bacterium]
MWRRYLKKKETENNSWTFLTNHSHVLLCLAKDPEMKIATIAEQVGITQRAVQRIMADLDEAGYLVRKRIGRRNRYRIKLARHLRHQIEKHRTIDDLLLFAVDFEKKNSDSEENIE